MKCPFFSEFGKWIECPHLETDSLIEPPEGCCADDGQGCGKGGSWCAKMIGRAMLSHKIWIGNDY